MKIAEEMMKIDLEDKCKRPKIVVLCGSSRFIETIAILAWELEKNGNIALGLHLLPKSYFENKYSPVIPHHLAEFEGVRSELDELHLRKIDLADEVFIVNQDGYIGDSTRNEIEYAKKIGKKINYLVEVKA